MGFKTKLDITGQKVKGMTQQIKGDVEIKSGQKIKGTIDKVRGKANEIEADLRNKVDNNT
ncbi:hypothetical protein A2334_04665 [Candidatus Roizmanbacteria bacterium RIFOXYB2_FULL_38_10]|uniref:CsbD-like domain-containing protein n=1 Tax=Candidatus Roizmanbacteria bacterium RIFOXYD1_FULL_38_12 TaxID=1802093 RepID=A0A1F7KZK8_9BACT|nr:MAG: hypothetical protein A3K47_00765 [Candidatus Roizmanbacteria bacterium RIFOXYA2_FULL_38_14]OGK63320.1 MAG: hypothetical protein A3K27_00765 [Candidatus Roizmanbacteria bacterium RIFOXYA1_FULL_37_12]OGK65166.1 MAG: hypothetical protein A3K38_00765 [Candidatus Roizmanbacteria bacterium RIFOXYB1_FULL_40_23]OGK68722.1 MAG: hypothetical protein A2334_04665 [Candidatus Roizmanbacteria bacterium RIFOXYB2_FULL_38_10]OGK69571.1 MAG: hypothetical protein A3K21_00770 [Candidatus Roizmanbacteria ba